ncbi:MAG TPA: DUF2156 domain-containing protein [Gemmatimonadaceae bacterium]|nr:DUF2156 domain-containing protein [Gemmatimonadaceae bacterium]
MRLAAARGAGGACDANGESDERNVGGRGGGSEPARAARSHLPPPTSDPIWQHARALVLRFGWNATAYQILNPGIRLWVPPSGDAVVGYVRHAGVRVVAGAPVCDRARLLDVAHAFESEARAAGERVCYFGAGTRLERVLRVGPRRSTVLLGAQPVWRPSGWPAIVASRKSLRAQLNRARNKGVAVVEWAPAAATDSPELRRVLAEWLSTRGLPPLHFLVEPETLARVEDRRVFVAERTAAGGDAAEPVGFLLASPVPQRNGWLVEQIIRGHRAPNGTNELMVDAAMRALAASGADYVTLGLSPLSTRATVDAEDDDAPPHSLWLRVVLAWTRLHGRRFYNFDGLDAFKAKLHPDAWEPIFAISIERRFSVRTLYAIAAAFSAGSPVLLVARAVWGAVRAEVKRVAGSG